MGLKATVPCNIPEKMHTVDRRIWTTSLIIPPSIPTYGNNFIWLSAFKNIIMQYLKIYCTCNCIIMLSEQQRIILSTSIGNGSGVNKC